MLIVWCYDLSFLFDDTGEIRFSVECEYILLSEGACGAVVFLSPYPFSAGIIFNTRVSGGCPGCGYSGVDILVWMSWMLISWCGCSGVRCCAFPYDAMY